MYKSIIGFMLSAILLIGAGCQTVSLDPNTSQEVFQAAVQVDSVKVKHSSYTATGIYLLTIDNVEKRTRVAREAQSIATKVKTHVASLENFTQGDVRMFTLALINASNLSLDDKQILGLLLNSVSIVVDDAVTVELPASLSNDRRIYAVKSFLTSACDGVLQAVEIYGRQT